MISAVATSLVVALLAPAGPFTTAPTDPVVPPPPPKVSAESWAVYDETADVMLATWNLIEQRPMASVTKVLKALIVLYNSDIYYLVTVPALSTSILVSSAGLVEW